MKTIATTLIAVAALLCAVPTAALAQEESSSRIETISLRVYKLQHVDTKSAEKALQRLLFDRVQMFADARTQQLLVQASDRVHGQIEQLIEAIDLRATADSSPSNEFQTRVIRLQHRSVRSVLPTFEMHNVGISAIEATNSLVVRGTKTELDEFERVLQMIDIELPAMQLECWILEAGATQKIASHPELSALENELAKTGLRDYGVLSHTLIRGTSGERFTSEQDFIRRRIAELGLAGTVHLTNNGGVRLQLLVEMSLTLDTGTDENPPGQGSYSLSTELKTQTDRLVVVGLAPTGGETQKPLVLVLRIRD